MVPDFEVKDSYSVRISSTDAAGLTYEKAFTLTITDVNEAPAITSGNSGTVVENAAISTVIYTVTSSDVDAGATATYSIKSNVGDASLVSINSSTGEVTLNTSADFEAKSIYTFTVVVTDNGALTGEKSVTVTVTDVNEAPVLAFSPSQGNLVEAGGIANAISGTPTASMTLTASDPEGQAVNFNITYLTSNGWSSADSGITYSKAGTYGTAALTIATGDITYTLDNSASVTQALTNGLIVTDTFTVQAVDDTSISSTINAVFSITGANDSPNLVTALGTGSTSSPDQTKSGAGDWTYTVPANAFADVDSTLSYTATLGNGSALPGWLTFNSASRTFAGNPPSSVSGTTLVLKVTASDGTSSTFSVFLWRLLM